MITQDKQNLITIYSLQGQLKCSINHFHSEQQTKEKENKTKLIKNILTGIHSETVITDTNTRTNYHCTLPKTKVFKYSKIINIITRDVQSLRRNSTD